MCLDVSNGNKIAMPDFDESGNLCGLLHVEDPETGGPFTKCYCVLNKERNELECYQSYLQVVYILYS